jgi:hypothetical protein
MGKTKQNISILVVLLYSWQMNVNTKKFQVLGDVYYGVQIAYLAIIGSQLSILVLSAVLIAGINSVSAPANILMKLCDEHLCCWKICDGEDFSLKFKLSLVQTFQILRASSILNAVCVMALKSSPNFIGEL